MIVSIINFINESKYTFTSVLSALAGSVANYTNVAFISLESANTFFQHAAWTVAIFAGIVSIINGVKTWKLKKNTVKQKQKIRTLKRN